MNVKDEVTFLDNGKIADELKNLLKSDNFNLVIPDQVKIEWERNKKEKVVNEKIQSFTSKIKNVVLEYK